MTNFEYLTEREEYCERVARETGDEDLRTFFSGAADGFKKRILSLSVEEAAGEIAGKKWTSIR